MTANGYSRYEAFTVCGKLTTMARDAKEARRNFRYQLYRRGLNWCKVGKVDLGDVRAVA